jgi:phosphotransferase system IIB component
MVRQQFVLTVIKSYAERKAVQVVIGLQAEHIASEIKEKI